MLNRIAGRTALVTGAGNGLGREIALHLAGSGARVLLVGRNRDNLDAVAADITRGEHGTARAATCDLAKPDEITRLATTFADEEISVLVNNAGIPGPTKALVDVSVAEWQDVHTVNVRGVFLMCRAFLPPMVARGAGDIINIASVSGKRPLIHRTPYVSSKMAVIGLTTTLAFEVGPLGVNVNSLSPGPAEGPRMAMNFERTAKLTGVSCEQAEHDFVSRAAQCRMVTAAEVGQAVVAMLHMPGLCAADIDLSAGMVGR